MLNLAQYAGLLLYTVLGSFFIGSIFFFSYFFRERTDDPRGKTIYECGMAPIGSPWVSPNIRFYVFALIFVIFDVESVFLFPWAVQFKTLGWTGFIEMLVFIAVLLVPFAYAWKKGALKWE
jgi:NADH:ubiquinone oxidoreductase subunit 3 (subunit A)